MTSTNGKNYSIIELLFELFTCFPIKIINWNKISIKLMKNPLKRHSINIWVITNGNYFQPPSSIHLSFINSIWIQFSSIIQSANNKQSKIEWVRKYDFLIKALSWEKKRRKREKSRKSLLEQKIQFQFIYFSSPFVSKLFSSSLFV